MEWGPGLISLAVVMAAWMGLAAVITLISRLPRPHRRVRATPELRDEPPALVDYLRHEVLSAPAAAAATLFDLAARGYVELSLAADPGDMTVRRSTRDASDLEPFELAVYNRVGSRPLTLAQISRSHAPNGKLWRQRLEVSLRAHAEDRGYLRNWDLAMWFFMGALVLGLILGFVVGFWLSEILERVMPGPLAGMLALGAGLLAGALIVIVQATAMIKLPERRPSPKARAAAAHWRGVRRWMREHGPGTPGARDRRFAYAVAVGAVELPRAARLGVGTDETVESGGRTVQVAYPPRQTARSEVRLAAAVVGIAGAVWLAWLLRERPVIVSALVVAAGLGYVAVRALLDLRPVEVVGMVVKVLPAGTAGDREYLANRIDAANTPAVRPAARGAYLWMVRRQHVADDGVVLGYFLVVDDGRSDRLAAWFVPPRRFRPWRPGATVRLRGQRWSRHALSVQDVPRTGVLSWVPSPE